MSRKKTSTYSAEISVSVQAADAEAAWLQINELASQMISQAEELGCEIGEVSEPECLST